jgi:DNA-binding beta-propeller fold protein YncE
VIDTFENRVQTFDTTSRCLSATNCPAIISQFGGRNTAAPDGFLYPVAADFAGGNLWTGATDAVIRWDAAGNFLARLGSHGRAAGQFSNGPRGLAVFPNSDDPSSGVMYATDINPCRLQKLSYSSSSTVLTPVKVMGSCGNLVDQLAGPEQVAVTADQSLAFVADKFHSRIAVWNPATGAFVRSINGTFDTLKPRLSQPEGVAVDPTGTWLYIADTKNLRIVRTRLDGTSPQVVTYGADTPAGKLVGPQALAFGPDGRLYVSDNSRRVYVFTVTG